MLIDHRHRKAQGDKKNVTWLLYQSGTGHLLAKVVSVQAEGCKTYCSFSARVWMECVLFVLCFVYPSPSPPYCNDCLTAE